MKIVISVHGKFHATYLAEYFEAKGMLKQFITTYPVRHITNKFKISKKFITSLPLKLILETGLQRLFGIRLNEYFLNQLFDKQAKRRIDLSADVYFLWSGCSLLTIQKIKQKNSSAFIILVRGSAHIEVQQDLLNKANAEVTIDKRLIEKEKQEYTLVDFIAVPSTFAKLSFIEKGFIPEKIFLNLLGVDLNKFQAKNIDDLLPGTVIRFCYAGILSLRKNVKGIIDVLEACRVKGVLAEFHIAGPIDTSTFDKKWLQKSWIRYYGTLDQEDLISFYNKNHVFILNSVEDGFAVVLLQAMAIGLPIIATENSGGPDLINGNGFIIPAFDTQQLQSAVQYFVDNPASIRIMGEKSVSISKGKFSWKDFGERHIQLLNEIRGRKK